MCVAVYKPQGVDMPSKKTLNICFKNNDDGAGFMFAHNGKVHIEKGFMSFASFKKALKYSIKKYGLNVKETPMAFHFRISTQGGIKRELCHPYALSNSYDEMKELKGDYDFGVMHNGIIDLTSSYHITDHNDTMEYIKEIVYPLVGKNKNYYKNNGLMSVMKYTLDGNRFLIMDGNGHTELLGGWEQSKGVYYSNSSYKQEKVYTHITKVNFNDWTHIGHIANSGSVYKDNTKKVQTKTPAGYLEMTSQMISDLYNHGYCYCSECGEEIYFDYDNAIDSYVGICLGCGEIFVVDDDLVDFLISEGYVVPKEEYDDDYDYYGEMVYGGAR